MQKIKSSLRRKCNRSQLCASAPYTSCEYSSPNLTKAPWCSRSQRRMDTCKHHWTWTLLPWTLTHAALLVRAQIGAHQRAQGDWQRTQRVPPTWSEATKARTQTKFYLGCPARSQCQQESRREAISSSNLLPSLFLHHLYHLDPEGMDARHRLSLHMDEDTGLALPLGNRPGPGTSHLRSRNSLWRPAVQHNHAFDGNLPSLRILLEVLP